MVLDGNTVLIETRAMRNKVLARTHTTEQLKIDHPYLHVNAPHLFDMIVANKFNYMPMIIQLVNKLNTVVDEPTKNKADEKVGYILFDKYVKPGLSNPEKEDLKSASDSDSD
jgi:hypothetical protein